MINKKEQISQLISVFLKLETTSECEALFEDLFTPGEVSQFAQRITAAKLLMEGKTYEEVIKETDISSATLSRVSRCVKLGNGYKNLLSK